MAAHRIDQHGITGPDPTSRRWEPDDPRRDRTAIPYTDSDTHALIEQAAYLLTIFRAPMSYGDAGAKLSVLVSLAVEAQDGLHDTVADARHQGYTWDEIADRLNTSATTARRRYRAYTNWRRTQLDND